MQLEALACGTPVAAFPVTGPNDVIDEPAGRRAERRFARRVPAGSRLFAPDLPRLCPRLQLGEQRPAIHRLICKPLHAGRVARGREPAESREPDKAFLRTFISNGLNHMKAKAQLNNDMVVGAYDRWAPVYDLVFGPVFRARPSRPPSKPPKRSAGAFSRSASAPASRCADYSPQQQNRRHRYLRDRCCERRRARVAELGLTHVEQLAVMDASELDFPDNSFDVVVAQYVVTTVPKPEQTLDEFARVLKPGGEIILLSRVSDETGLRRSIEHLVRAGRAQARLAHRIRLGAISGAGSRTHPRIELVERRATPPLRPFLAHPVPQKRSGEHPIEQSIE